MGLRDTLDRIVFGPELPTTPRSDASVIAVRGDVDPNRRADWLIAGRQADFNLWDNDRLRIDAVMKCVTVFACSTLLADAVAEAPLQIQKKDGDEWKPDEAPAARFAQGILDRPNPNMEDAEFWGLVILQQCIQGYAVVEKFRRPGGMVTQLWPLRPDWLHRKRRDDGTADNDYEYHVPGLPPRTVPADDLIFLPFRHDPLNMRKGIGPVTVAAREIGIDSKLTEFLKTFLDAGGIPPFIMTFDEIIEDKSEVTKIQTDWEQKYGGALAWGKLPVMHSGAKIEKVGDGIGEMAWPDLRGLTELKIIQAFGVPPGLVQAFEGMRSGPLTSTETDGDMTFLQRYGAEPLRMRNAGAMARELLHEYGLADGNHRLKFDTSNILALQEDTDAVHTRVRANYQARLITMNEARVAMGMDPLPKNAGDVFLVGFSDMFVPAADLVAVTGGDVPDDPKPLALPASTNAAGLFRSLPAAPLHLVKRDVSRMDAGALEVRANAQRRIMKDRKRLIEIGTRQMRKFFNAQGARIADAFAKADDRFEVRSFAERSESDIFWDDEQAKLSDVLKLYYLANGQAAFATAGETVGLDIAWDVTNPRILQLQDQLGRRIVRIAERTRKDVIRTIAEATQEGKPIADIAAEIVNLFEQTYRGRAETVARTETQVAYNQSSALAYAESGQVNQCELLDNPDHDEEYGAADGLTCAERDGLIVDLIDVDIHIAGEHPNGSLIVLGILSNPLGEA